MTSGLLWQLVVCVVAMCFIIHNGQKVKSTFGNKWTHCVFYIFMLSFWSFTYSVAFVNILDSF